ASSIPTEASNAVDDCWRRDPVWSRNRQRLAACSVGYAGKMTGNVGPDVVEYAVTNPNDDPLNPRPGTLRYAMTNLRGKVWITFAGDMNIKLVQPLFVRSHSVIDGRGANVHISGGACLALHQVTDVIVHGLHIHGCKASTPGRVVGPDGRPIQVGRVDGDAIRIVSSSKIWIDHNTLQDCEDGLIDVSRGSTDITISNNWFKFQDKVMLLGHDDGFLDDRRMKVTVAFNHFGPNCNQRMPRVRFGYAHVVNNLYLGWGIYAIGASMNPSIKSQANLFIAPNGDNKDILWDSTSNARLRSVQDVFENGASFKESLLRGTSMRPNYRPDDQAFPVGDGRAVKSLTKSAGALNCS
ncbi:hypothetical protein M569_14096, partial [Genlisea aurea]